MKKCNKCGIALGDQVDICPTCGSDDFSIEPAITSSFENVPDENNNINDNGNILAGIVGAFLFSLIGGALYFIVYQLGIIAGICGLVTFILANFGYGLFARTKNKLSLVALISSIVMTFIALLAAEYMCMSYEVYLLLKEEFEVTFFEAVRATPIFFEEPEVVSAFIKDLAIAYVFTIIASAGNVMNIIRARKNK